MKDYAFVHSEDRGAAVKATGEMNGKERNRRRRDGNSLSQATRQEKGRAPAARQAPQECCVMKASTVTLPAHATPIRGRGRGRGRGGYGYPPDYYGMKITMMITMVMISRLSRRR